MCAAILKPVGKGCSFFSFIEDYCHSEKHCVSWSIHRLCSLMRKMAVEKAAIENIDATFPEISEECAALDRRWDGSLSEIAAYRITFINANIDHIEEINDVPSKKFLASLIIINFKVDGTWFSYLFKAIVALPGIQEGDDRKLILNNYIHVYKSFPCEIVISESLTRQFEIVGTYFSQQNSATSVCGHAALCTAINNMKTYAGPLVSPETVNSIIGADHKTRKFGQLEGLKIEDIRKVLDNFTLRYTEMNFISNPNMEYDETIYRYIESGFPTLLIFSTKDSLHVVTVLGHTLNSDLWRPEAEVVYTKPFYDTSNQIIYQPAAAWVDHFIIHDDNFGMYLCLPVEALKRITIPKYDPTFRVYHAVMITPPNITTSAYAAELASVIVSKHIILKYKGSKAGIINDWLQRILLLDQTKMASVVRTMLVNRDDYAMTLDDIDFMGNAFTQSEKAELLRDLPPVFWLSEISLPDLYCANKTKVIDFFFPADLLSDDLGDILCKWIQIRFPEALLKNAGSAWSVYNMSIRSHYPLFRLRDEPPRSEW